MFKMISRLYSFPECTGSGLEGINFLHSNTHSAMFWICEQNSVDNTQAGRE